MILNKKAAQFWTAFLVSIGFMTPPIIPDL